MPPVITPERLALQRRADPTIRLLDVRTPAEHASAHIPGSYNVPVDELAEHAAEIRSMRSPVVLVCQSGQRARKAEAILGAAGMTMLHVLDGGMHAWQAAHLPVLRGRARLSLERQVRIAAGTLAAAGALLALVADPLFAIVPLAVGSGLTFAGVTNTCGMAMMLGRLPYNRSGTCDVRTMVTALTSESHAGAAGQRCCQADRTLSD